MKKIVACFVVLAVLATGCQRKMSREDVEEQLKIAMSNSLNSRVNFDTTVAKFTVEKVTFFDGKANYDCEFIVRERKPGGYDTTGAMAANISKDFKTVNRKY